MALRKFHASFRKLLVKPGFDSSEENQRRGNTPQSKNVAESYRFKAFLEAGEEGNFFFKKG